MRYAVAACQTDFPAPSDRAEIASRVDRMLEMIDGTVVGYRPFFPVRLVVFPEFSHAAPIYESVRDLREKLAVPVPNEHTERYEAKARQHGIYIQTGSFIETDSRWPGVLFNTSCLVGPEGLLSKYRKVNPWVPWELHASPLDVPGYDAEVFPVAATEIGNLACAICYDWLFPETIRRLVHNGAEVLVRVSAYMDPWGATSPMDWWTVVNRCRALENMAYVVAANQGAALRHYPPFSWPGGSMVVDYDGRILAAADPGPGEKVVVAEIDLGALREARRQRLGHNPLAHLRHGSAGPTAGRGLPPGAFVEAPNPAGDRIMKDNLAQLQAVLAGNPWGKPAGPAEHHAGRRATGSQTPG
jgi:predicted amidohydrolase